MKSPRCYQTKSVTIVLLLTLALFTGSARAALIASYDFEDGYINSGIGAVVGQPRGGASIVADPGGGLKAANNVLKLYGNDEYVKIGNGDVGAIANIITVAAWVKSDGTNWSDAGIATRGYNWRLFVSGSANGTIQAMDTQPGGSKARGSVNINDGLWHHIAGVYDGTQYTMYVDGMQDGVAVPASGPIQQTTSHKFNIGAFESSGSVSKFYDGFIDEVKIFDEALSPAAIRALVPEPATIALLAFGGLLIRRRKN